MKQSWRSAYNQNHLVFKLGISILFVGFGFRLLFTQSPSVIPNLSDNNINTPLVDKNQIHPKDDKSERCDMFDGEWIPNSGEAPYTNNSCRWIQRDQNCMTNGRPDTGYLYWRWSPKDCELPRFDAKKFLEMMKDKSWAFVGDSITRNHLQSFICVLSQVEDAIELFHDTDFKNQKWQFPSYNLTVSVIWSPFLAKADAFEDINHIPSSEIQLHVDVLDKTWTEQFNTWDYVLFSSGKWFVRTAIYYENNTILGCHGCQGKNHTDLGFNIAYQKVINNLFDFLMNSHRKSMIIYRTSTPDHFQNGSWSSGGTCDRRVPAKEGEFELGILNRILREVELTEFAKAEAQASEKGKKFKLLDVTPLSLVRPDGHPGAYRYFYPFAKDKKAKVQYDCLHWCLPGPIDQWNDLLMKLVVDG
ncbi:hypothetical protein L2E82_40524 [Cichorium intybus]|uniref:Uncharacterized protein n=1 Tax=Cichorium intybus TaxID=13427 RepID=A0ACB9AMY3_CICIN|nr:hypothetical protein L2E82_40524 [Cichorium intybus]